MTIFDRVFQRDKEDGPVVLSTPEAFAAVAVAAIAADGAVTDDEANRTAMDLATLSIFRTHDLREMGEILNKVALLIQRRGPTVILQAAKTTLTKAQAESAFFLAADLTLADGTFDLDERQYLEQLKNTLGVDDSTALKIVEVVVIKNRS
ncbi:MAG: tellurite resistance TerB family protein [Chloroflexi bacterium]|nr:tellurite resistance TerB family protein [Chloroflexota bacterium]